MSFSDFFAQFLERIKSKDLSVIEETLNKEVPLRILLPFGDPITDHDEFAEGQRKYFESSETSFDYEVVSTEESSDLGFGVCVTRVRIPEVDSYQEFRNQICFLFKRHEGKWILTFDQNTKMDG